MFMSHPKNQNVFNECNGDEAKRHKSDTPERPLTGLSNRYRLPNFAPRRVVAQRQQKPSQLHGHSFPDSTLNTIEARITSMIFMVSFRLFAAERGLATAPGLARPLEKVIQASMR
jgi:hypothetical protein